MRKNIVKVLLLVIALSISIYGVLYWKHTVVDPPKQLEFENAHLADLSKSISKVVIDSLEISYQECRYKLQRYQKEELIQLQEATIKLEDLVDIYAPLFIRKSKEAFSKAVWDQRSWSHSFMANRIEELKNLTKYDGNKIIDTSSTYIADMDEINAIINRYNDAWKLSTLTRYSSIAATKEREKQANEYKNDPNLKNCSELVKALNELPFKIKNNHLGYLRMLSNNIYCPGLEYYKDFSEGLTKLYDKTIKNYEDYYNTTSDTKTIKSDLRDKQYQYLKEYSDYVLNVYHFDTWEEYKVQNEKVYSYFSNCVGNDSRIKELKDTYLTKFLKTEAEFNTAKGIKISAPKFA